MKCIWSCVNLYCEQVNPLSRRNYPWNQIDFGRLKSKIYQKKKRVSLLSKNLHSIEVDVKIAIDVRSQWFYFFLEKSNRNKKGLIIYKPLKIRIALSSSVLVIIMVSKME